MHVSAWAALKKQGVPQAPISFITSPPEGTPSDVLKAWAMAVHNMVLLCVCAPPGNHGPPSFRHRPPASQLAVFLPSQMLYLEFRNCHPLLLEYLYSQYSKRWLSCHHFFFKTLSTRRPQTRGPLLVYSTCKSPGVTL